MGSNAGSPAFTRPPQPKPNDPKYSTGPGTFDGRAYTRDLVAWRNWKPDKGDNPPGQVPGSTAAPDMGARAYLEQVLGEYGLEAAAEWAYGLWVQGYEVQYIMAELRKRPEWADRFPGMEARRAAGLTPISAAEYVATERVYDEYMHAAGLTGMFDRKGLYTRWIGGDVSPGEAKARVEGAHQAAMAEPLETRQEMQRMFGVAAGPAAIAYFLDPQNSLPLITSQLRQAQIGGTSIRSMYGLLSQTEAENLDRLGVNVDAAQQGFGDLVRRRELNAALPGEAGETITRQEQLAAEFAGDAIAQEKYERAASRRRATAQGGGQYRVARTGVVGLGDSSQ